MTDLLTEGENMATNTYMTYLMNSADGSLYEKLVDIVSQPDLGSAPEGLDATTLSDPMKVYIQDIKDPGGTLEFEANYTPDDYEKLVSHEGKEEYYSIWLGGSGSGTEVTPDGSLGKFSFKGTLSCWLKESAVSAVRKMGIGITPSTPVEFSVGE